MFVDYSSKKIGIANSATGEVLYAEILRVVMGSSNHTCAEATWSCGLDRSACYSASACCACSVLSTRLVPKL